MEISEKKKKEMIWTMILSRKFSDSLVELCRIEGKNPGMMILSTGQEAAGLGVCAACFHRAHGLLFCKNAGP
jgi:pyruvate dehydrogenase E1 component alpha subunit